MYNYCIVIICFLKITYHVTWHMKPVTYYGIAEELNLWSQRQLLASCPGWLHFARPLLTEAEPQ